MDSNKFQKNSKYFTITVYAVVGFLICALLFKVIFQFSVVWNAVKVVVHVLAPFIAGTIIAYLINPMYKFFGFTVFKKWFHMTKKKKLRKTLALVISYIIVLGIVAALIYIIVPQFVESIRSLIEMIGPFSKTVQGWISALQDRFQNLDLSFLTKNLDKLIPNIQDKLQQWAEGLLSGLLSTGVGVISGIINAILSIFVSIYILSDKSNLEKNIRKLYYALFKPEKASTVSRITRECSNLFSNFFTGKIFDSLIIGILCSIGMLILRLPYPLLVSVMVGVTNIIPYFGPVIGAIPSVLIMLMTGWKPALIFLIFFIILQQIDGNLIGPKILGNSTGLSPIWILFAITIGSWAGGFAGMIFGVPVMAVIAHIAEEIINNRLEKKGLQAMVERGGAPTTLNYSDMILNIFKKKPKKEEAKSLEDKGKDNNDGDDNNQSGDV